MGWKEVRFEGSPKRARFAKVDANSVGSGALGRPWVSLNPHGRFPRKPQKWEVFSNSVADLRNDGVVGSSPPSGTTLCQNQVRWLDPAARPNLPRRLMTHLNAIAATRTVHLWWHGWTLAARWRD